MAWEPDDDSMTREPELIKQQSVGTLRVGNVYRYQVFGKVAKHGKKQGKKRVFWFVIATAKAYNQAAAKGKLVTKLVKQLEATDDPEFEFTMPKVKAGTTVRLGFVAADPAKTPPIETWGIGGTAYKVTA